MTHTFKVNKIENGKQSTLRFFNDKKEMFEFMRDWSNEWDKSCIAIKGAENRARFFTHKSQETGKYVVMK